MPIEPSQDAPLVDKLAHETYLATGIYGLIVACAVMAASHSNTAGQVAVSVLVTLVVYWAAERYARVMARRIAHGPSATLDRSVLLRELGHGWELVTASFLPLGVLLGSKVLGATVSGAVLAALVCGTLIMAAAGWQIGRQASFGHFQCFLSGAAAGAFGGAMILLKALLH